ncbi:MAG: aminotransferase class I/II-fold pyridoxal phosphate-dependent enzyme [Peptococcaceae bacterium]|jgi:aromatic-amino-acid transaminase|nr:aminotransferase class I/II-fold pyridoxal phosphate-dependent enzyme [Peptococcaceae bacterium]MDH7526378.1 aminotransferase class I/II-fold pyridoxal phosphate-dependent enzyme [Peptococcaceae bacterium]
MSISLAASHAAGKGKEGDAVFTILKRANDAIAALGPDKVVNASIGAIYDEEERFAAFKSVSEYYRSMPDEELMNYASIAGQPEFLEAAVEFTFGNHKPENAYIKAVATPGGTGAVRHAFYNYLEQGQKALIPDWFWGPYQTIAAEHLRGVETYRMFDENNNFTLASVKEKTAELLTAQDSVVIVFNTPGHNPTGYSMSIDEWRDVLDFFKECAGDRKKKMVLLLDLAYIDYVRSPDEARAFMKLFGGLPENILVTMAFSMSKSFLLYGMRCGAFIGISSSPEVAEEFYQINTYSCRGVWSNGTRGAQKLLADVMKNPALKESIDQERKTYSELLLKRAGIFVEEAREVGLPILPYHGGFFISVPVENSKAIAEKLMAENIFFVPLKKGLRIAVCGLPVYKIPGLAAKTKAALK